MNIRPIIQFVTKNWWWVSPLVERAYNWLKPHVKKLYRRLPKIKRDEDRTKK